MSNRHTVGMSDAVVAVVPAVATAHRRPLLGACGRPRRALPGAGYLAAIVSFTKSAEVAFGALGHLAAWSAGSGRGGSWLRALALARIPRGDPMRMSDTDVDVGAPVAAADRAVVLGARRRHGEAGASRAALAALRIRAVVADESLLAGLARSTAALPARPIRIPRRLALLRAGTQQAQAKDRDDDSLHGGVGIPDAQERQVASRT